jgi:hypothetical protein
MQIWSLENSNNTPIANTIITLSFVHFTQLLTLYLVLLEKFDILNIFSADNKIYIGLFIIVFFFFNYFFLYSEKKWAIYIKEFENESKRERRLGNLYVVSYLIGSILLFFIALILLYA